MAIKDKKEQAKKAEQSFAKTIKAKLGKVALVLRKAMVSCLSQNVETKQVDLAHAQYRVSVLQGFESIASSKEYQSAANDKTFGNGKGLSLWNAAVMLTGIDKQVAISGETVNVSRGSFSGLLQVATCLARPTTPKKVKDVVYDLTAKVGRSELAKAIREYQNEQDNDTATLVRTLLPEPAKKTSAQNTEHKSRSPLEYLTDATSAIETLLSHMDVVAKQEPDSIVKLRTVAEALVKKAENAFSQIKTFLPVDTLAKAAVSGPQLTQKVSSIPANVQPTAESKAIAKAIKSAQERKAREQAKDLAANARRASENSGKQSIAQA